jgi:hypothetical protein
MAFFENGDFTWVGPLVRPEARGKAPVMCLVGNDRPLHGAGLARRSALETIGGFDVGLRFWECEEVTARLAKVGRLEPAPADEPLYVWRLHRDKIYIGGEGARYKSSGVALGWLELVLRETGGERLDSLNLPRADRDRLLDYCTTWGRLLYAQDRPAFRQYLTLAQRLVPDIAPSHPRYVTMLARLAGYEGAEGIARLARWPKAVARKTLESLRLMPRRTAVYDWS